jgi:hypothetical protein
MVPVNPPDSHHPNASNMPAICGPAAAGSPHLAQEIHDAHTPVGRPYFDAAGETGADIHRPFVPAEHEPGEANVYNLPDSGSVYAAKPSEPNEPV